MSIKKKNIIIDCDPGQDDAVAIIIALASKKINVEALTIVGGNVALNKCVNNAKKILGLTNRLDIPIYSGESNPLRNKLKTLECVFGESGLAGANDLIIPRKRIAQLKAKDFLKKTFSQNNDTIICGIAPMTNLAKAILEKPEIANNIKEFTMMGGCVFPEPIRNEMGNMQIANSSEKAEYNVFTDPEAFNIILKSNIKIINMIGLDITRTVLYNFELDNKLKQIKNSVAQKVSNILSTVGEEDKLDYKNQKKFINDPVRAIHDVLAVIYILDPSIFSSTMLPIKVELINTKKKGQTLIAEDGRMVNVINKIDKNKFFELFIELLKKFN
jgi:inosine-uridine nucleoside N-ribohydrolase